MTPHEQHVRKLHAALHHLCGLPQLSATMTDLMTWETFLGELKPLNDTEGGAFTLADLTAVLSMMAKQKREGVGWSMSPHLILQKPEKFRDLVLHCRKDMAVKKRFDARRRMPRAVQKFPDGTLRRLDDREPEPETMPVGPSAAAELAKLRKEEGV